VFIIGYSVIIYEIADMDDFITFTTVKDCNAEVQVIGALKRYVCITNYADIIFARIVPPFNLI